MAATARTASPWLMSRPQLLRVPILSTRENKPNKFNRLEEQGRLVIDPSFRTRLSEPPFEEELPKTLLFGLFDITRQAYDCNFAKELPRDREEITDGMLGELIYYVFNTPNIDALSGDTTIFYVGTLDVAVLKRGGRVPVLSKHALNERRWSRGTQLMVRLPPTARLVGR